MYAVASTSLVTLGSRIHLGDSVFRKSSVVDLWAYSSVVEYRFPKPLTEVQVLVGPQQKTNKPPANSWWFVSLVHALRHVRLMRETETCRFATVESGSRVLNRFGAEGEQICLVTRDRQPIARAARAGGTGIFLLFLE